MKVIDLLNKIANGEDVPKKVKYNGIIYGYNSLNKHGLRYIALEDDINTTFCFLINNVNALHDEVEIIEEEPEIDIQGIEDVDERYPGESPDVKYVCAVRINELIKAVKQLDRKMEDKE